VEIYLSPIETHCSNIDYFPSIDNAGDTEEATRLHLARGVIALFILSFLAVVCAFFTGLSGMACVPICFTKMCSIAKFIFFAVLIDRSEILIIIFIEKKISLP